MDIWIDAQLSPSIAKLKIILSLSNNVPFIAFYMPKFICRLQEKL